METKGEVKIIDSRKEFEQKFAEILTHDVYHIETAKLEFADEIYDLMEEQNLNQSQLAEKLGLSKQYVSKLLSGYANPSIATMVKVARRLNCKFSFRLDSKIEQFAKWNKAKNTPKQEIKTRFKEPQVNTTRFNTSVHKGKKNVYLPIAS